jgi:hypothetical protein
VWNPIPLYAHRANFMGSPVGYREKKERQCFHPSRRRKGPFSRPLSYSALTRAHEWQAANDERRRLCLKALAFERFPSECPPAANDERQAVPVNWLLCACSSVFSDLDSVLALRQSLGKQKRRK